MKRIRTEHAIEVFESTTNLARALGIKSQAISQWGEYVPKLRAYELRELLPARFIT
jgi:hypothetical protein